MKKKYLIILLMMILSFFISVKVNAVGEVYNGESLTINLTEGPAVSGEIPNLSENILHVLDDSSSELCQYNCHFYTFFVTVPIRWSAVNGNFYILGDDANKFLRTGDYINTGVYEETDKYHAEIIAYYGSNGTLKHTGRVFQVTNDEPLSDSNDLNTVWVRSKWEIGYIYEHRADAYTLFNNTETYTIKYFAYHHNHRIVSQLNSTSDYHHVKCTNSNYCQLDLTSSHIPCCVSNNNLTHNVICSICDYTIDSNVNHSDFTYTNVDSSNHRKHCGYCNYSTLEPHDWHQFNDILFICNDCNARARYIPIIHNGIYNPTNNLNNSTIICYNGIYYLLILEEDIYE